MTNGFSSKRTRAKGTAKEDTVAKKTNVVTHNRSAVTGRHETDSHAKKHPNTTVTEHAKKKPPKK